MVSRESSAETGLYFAADHTLAAHADSDPIVQRAEEAYQYLQQRARATELLGKLRPYREGDTIDQSHLDTVLREIATLHARVHDRDDYLGSSLGYYPEGGLWLYTQMGSKPDEGFYALCRELDDRTKLLPIEILPISTYPGESSTRTAIFGPAVFEGGPLGEVTYVGDLVPQRPNSRVSR